MQLLPAFSGLTAFYAAAREGSLTAAARVLNVSQPAVSRRIAALEFDLGCALFDRGHKPVRLTRQGRDLLKALHDGFGQIENAVAQISTVFARPGGHGVGPVGFCRLLADPAPGRFGGSLCRRDHPDHEPGVW